MNELILSHHPHLQPPATRSPGKNTIDSIFGTGSLIVKKAGYGPHLGFTDHRLAWVDIDWDSALGIFQKIQRPIARRLQCDDPMSVQQYLKILMAELDKIDAHRAIPLEAAANIPLSLLDAFIFEELDDEITRCTQTAEKKCRKLFMGGVPFSPELAMHLNQINLWRLLIRKKKRVAAPTCGQSFGFSNDVVLLAVHWIWI